MSQKEVSDKEESQPKQRTETRRPRRPRTDIPEHQIRVSTRGGIGGCISRAATLLLREENPL